MEYNEIKLIKRKHKRDKKEREKNRFKNYYEESFFIKKSKPYKRNNNIEF